MKRIVETDEQGRTPLPWKKLARNRDLPYGRGPGFDVIGASTAKNAGIGEIVLDKATEPDADFICLACNAHDALLLSAKCALADLEGIMPEYEPSGDRQHPAWKTIRELRKAIADAEKAGG